MILLYLGWEYWKSIKKFYLKMNKETRLPVSDKIINTINSIQQKPSEEIISQLIYFINDLINKDFQALVQLLYRIDVNEKKLKELLKQNENIDAASIIADLIINRQLQKIATKEQFKTKEKTKPNDDSW